MTAEPPQVITGDHPLASTEPFVFWLADHGIPVKDCYKVEIYKRQELIVYYCYARNRRGKFYIDVTAGDSDCKKLPPQRTRLKRPVPEGD